MNQSERRNVFDVTRKLDEICVEHLEEGLHDLRLATIRGDLQTIHRVLDKGVPVNQPLQGGWSALMYACSLNHPAIVQYLLQQGSDPNFDKDLFTPLMAVCTSTHRDESKLAECMDHLLVFKANVNATDQHHVSPLMFAAKEGKHKLVAQLLNSQCDINIQDKQRWTALFWAASRGRLNIVETLIKHGAKTDLQDSCGHTVLDLARKKNYQQIMYILSRQKSQPNILQPKLYPEPEIISQEPSVYKLEYTTEIKPDSVLQVLLEELSPSMNNNERKGTNFTRFFNSLDLENNLDVLKAHGQIIANLANSVNGCIQSSMSLANKCITPLEKGTKSLSVTRKNIPYSTLEAREVLSHVLRHLKVLQGSVSYVRLQLEGYPPASLIEDRHARTAEVTALADKALYQTKLLYDEIKFLHQYSRKLEGSDRVVSADFLTQHKAEEHQTSIVSTCVLAAAVVLVLFNTRVFTIPFFSK